MSSPRKRCGATAALLFVSETLAAGEARYFGLDVPRGIPARFEPAMFAPFAGQSRLTISAPAFSPDFRRFVFIVEDSSNPARVAVTVYEARRRGDGPSERWSPPAPVPMLTHGGFSAGETSFSRDGRWLYFTSSRPPGAQGLEPRIFRAAVLAEGFGAPEFIGIEPPQGGGTFYPRLLANGDLAFTAPGPADRDDLFVAGAGADGFDEPRALEGDFNTPQHDWDLVESADGALRIWVSARPGGAGKTDLYYSRRKAGRWSSARNLAAVNTPALETAPQLTPDDGVLFFLRHVDGVNRLHWVELTSVLEESP